MGFFTSAISRQQAIEIARTRAVRENWPWVGRIHVRRGWTCWHVMSNAGCSGANVRIDVHRQTGAIQHLGYAPR